MGSWCATGTPLSGALHIAFATATIERPIFEENSGTAFHSHIDSHTTISEALFLRNEGAVGTLQATLHLNDSTFIENSSSRNGGALVAQHSEVFVRGGHFEGNRSGVGAWSGAGVGGGAVAVVSATVSFRDTLFIENIATGPGGAVETYLGPQNPVPSEVVFENVIFADNEGTSTAAISARDASLTLTNCLFYGNRRSSGGTSAGAVIRGSTSDLVLRNVTMADHVFPALAAGNDTTLSVRSSILWGHDTAIESVTPPDVGYSLIQGGYTGTGNLSTNPLFLDPSTLNFQPSQGSPAIDCGDPDAQAADYPLNPSGQPVDLAGAPRIQGGRVDCGAYEAGT